MSWDQLYDTLVNIFVTQTGFSHITGGNVFMWAVGLFFLYLAVAKNFAPLLLVPIGFGIFIVNFPLALLMGTSAGGYPEFFRVFYHYGLEWEILPSVGIIAVGIWTVQILNYFSKIKMNPLIGSAGVSAVPMAARVSHVVGQEENPENFLLMHAMAPNLAGVIGTAAAKQAKGATKGPAMASLDLSGMADGVDGATVAAIACALDAERRAGAGGRMATVSSGSGPSGWAMAGRVRNMR